MHIVIAHAQIANEQPVWGIISRTGIVHRFLTDVMTPYEEWGEHEYLP